MTCKSYFICLNMVFGQQVWDFFSYEVKKIILSEVRFNPHEEILKQTLTTRKTSKNSSLGRDDL